MNYFVDPHRGSDSNSGTSGDAAWRSFARLEQQALGPGDRVEIAPGEFKHRLTLTGSGTPEAPIEVHFEGGRYDVFPDDARREIFHISNCNDDASNPKAVGILIRQGKHIAISGTDAHIICRGKMIEICLDHAENVTVSGLSFDYHRPTVSEFTVVAATQAYADLQVHEDSAYAVEQGRIDWRGEGWTYGTGLAQELIPAMEQVWRRKDPLVGLRIEELGPFKLRAHGAHDMVEGRVFQLRNPFRDGCGVFIRRSRNIVLRDVDFHFMHGMGILCQFTENITLASVRIAPEEGRGRTSAAWADCAHFSGCGGKLSITDCLFCGAHDDAINVHGTYMRIVEQVSGSQIKVRFMHRQTYGFMAFNGGDEVDFIRCDTLTSFGSNRVTESVMLDPHELLLTLDAPVPSDWRENDVLENVTWTAEVEIRGCTTKRIPTRGFLLTTRKKVKVCENHFYRTHMSGINIEADASNWFESGCVRDMTIRDNRFEACGGESILITPRHTVPHPGVHQDIRITGNTFILPKNGIAVKASGVKGLVVSGNRIELAAALHLSNAIVLNDCETVSVEKNAFRLPDAGR